MSAASETITDVVIIGAGQAGLSAGYHLARNSDLDFVMLDANLAPGGAWQHRWESLRMDTVNGIFDLPGMPLPSVDPKEPSHIAVPRYFTNFEHQMRLPIIRPVQVHSVSNVFPAPKLKTLQNDDGNPTAALPKHSLLVETSAGRWLSSAVINASGTWTNPRIIHAPGSEGFHGRQLHTQQYPGAESFRGQRVAVVGAGISALQHLQELSEVATTFWYTRNEPHFIQGDFRPEQEGRRTIERVSADAEAGEPVGSIVSYTGLIWTEQAQKAADRRALQRRPMFASLAPYGVREADGSFTSVDTVLWATGFEPALGHLAPLELVNDRGGIAVAGTEVRADPRVHLVGFGPSQSTVGANRAGAAAARILRRRISS